MVLALSTYVFIGLFYFEIIHINPLYISYCDSGWSGLKCIAFVLYAPIVTVLLTPVYFLILRKTINEK